MDGGERLEANEEILISLIREVEELPYVEFQGFSREQIEKHGYFEEGGLRLTREDIPLSIYYSGLAVLCKDMYEYLYKYPYGINEDLKQENLEFFKNIISSVKNEERKLYPPTAFPYNHIDFPEPDNLLQLSSDIAVSADIGQPSIEQLNQSTIVHEWTVKPGKRIFIKFAEKFKDTICGKDGPYEQFEKGLLGKASLPAAIVSAILTVGFSFTTFWLPLLVYIALLLIKTGLKTYCEE